MTNQTGTAAEPLSVHEAVALARGEVSTWPTLMVVGEISGFRGPNARSGHCYFEVKDETSSMSVIVWRSTASRLKFALRNGLKVLLTGKFDVYKASGKISFVASTVQLEGEGLLRQQVAELARKLEREGLMDESRKRAIPTFCERICVVTSLSGSVIEDVKRTLLRRNPLVEIDVVGCAVQGKDAPDSILRALAIAERSRPDAILLVRGGGSFEDLMCFNDERLARAIAACLVPVVTGIGHETDTTIADMVADRRTSTPTAAAESVAPPVDELERQATQLQVRLGRAMYATLSACSAYVEAEGRLAKAAMSARLTRERAVLDSLGSRPCLVSPLGTLSDREHDLDRAAERLYDAMPRQLSRLNEAVSTDARRLTQAGSAITTKSSAQVARLAASLEALSPLKVLARGYAITTGPSGEVLRSSSQVSEGDELQIRLAEGSVKATVTQAFTDSLDA